MSKVKSLKLIILAMIAFTALFPFVAFGSVEKGAGDETGKLRADRIVIALETMETRQEMPAVRFSHDLHTEAVEGKCTTCHEKKEDSFVFKFKRTDEPATMELYHEACFACHTEQKSDGKKAGPLEAECRACHAEKPQTASSWVAIDFNKSLHYTHEKAKVIKSKDAADQRNCSACHHSENEKNKKIFYAKGEEASCTYCHKAETMDKTRPMRTAAHDSCVQCHQALTARDIDAGPISCEGCHTAEGQKVIKTVKDIPRMDRNQPDVVVVKGWEDSRPDAKNVMNAVAFDHKSHETATASCKSCHHQTLNKCSDCHSVDGENLKGGSVSLAQAMHDNNASQSCVGCHKETTRSQDCAGCHSMTPAAGKPNPESCKKCHTVTPDQLAGMDAVQVAKTVVMRRTGSYTKVLPDKIPTTVEIKSLSRDYKPAAFPHKKIMTAIAARVEKSAMANAFHQDQSGLCMGCHHNSPKTLEPPKCASCHSRNSDGSDGMPGLKGAYHGQCIGCHQKMKIESVLATDCVKCHEAKK